MRVAAKKVVDSSERFSDWLLDKYSASKIKLHATCPQKAYRRYVLKDKEPDSAFFIYGKAVHAGQEADALAKLEGQPMKLKEVHELATEAYREHRNNAGLLDKEAPLDDFADDHARQLERFEDSGERARIVPVPGTVEATFQVELAVEGKPALLEGFTDVVVVNELGQKVAVDFKSAGRPMSEHEAETHIQLAIEALGAEAEAGRIVSFVKSAKQKATTKVTSDVQIRQPEIDAALRFVGEGVKSFRESYAKDHWPKIDPASFTCQVCCYRPKCWGKEATPLPELIQIEKVAAAGTLPPATWRDSFVRQYRESKKNET